MRQRLVRVLLSAAMLIGGAFPASVLAQGLTGQISGTVTDAGGGVMPGATVSIKNAGTNQVRETVTGADGAFTVPRPAGRHLRHHRRGPGLQDLRAEGHRARRDRARRAAHDRARGRPAAGDGHRHLRGLRWCRPPTPPVRASSTARRSTTSRVKGRDFASYLKLLPGVIDTSAREAPGWGSMGGLSINGRSGGFNFSYDGVTNKDTGSNSGNYAAPGARLDRRSARADLELPGRVRPQLRRDDHRRHPQRLEGLPRQRRLLQARRCLQRQRVPAPPAVRTGRQTAQCEPPARTSSTTRAWTLGGPVLIPGT